MAYEKLAPKPIPISANFHCYTLRKLFDHCPNNFDRKCLECDCCPDEEKYAQIREKMAVDEFKANLNLKRLEIQKTIGGIA